MFFLSFICLFVFFVACKKDIARSVSGEYSGISGIYYFNNGNGPQYPNTQVIITEVNKSTINMQISGSDPSYNAISQITLKENKTFGDGFYSPRGSFLMLGSEGKFYGDSLSFAFANTSDSAGRNVIYSFAGRRN